MKTTANFNKIISASLFTLIIMLSASGVSVAQVNMNETAYKNAYKAELLFASLEQNSPEIYILASLNEAFETVAIESWMLDPEVFIEKTSEFVYDEAMDVSVEENIAVEEWMKTDFSYSAQKIECQPLSEEPALKLEDWMMTDSAWNLEK